MTTNKESEMKEFEKNAVFWELANDPNVRWAFLHPILREWITEAPSVNSIDQWIRQQFHNYEYQIDLLKAMRKAVKL